MSSKSLNTRQLKKEHIVIDIAEITQKNDTFYSVEQTDDESREVYLNRVNYITERYEKNSMSCLTKDNTCIKDSRTYLIKIIQISYIWKNVHYYGMSYPNSILKIL